MATTEEQKEIPENAENPENQENPEEEKEEEEPVDLELQKEMKGIKISDSDFTNEPKAKKPYKKMKNPEEKKVKKKGQDFLDYANKNNIQINIQYEENKYQLKKKKAKNSEKIMQIDLMIIENNIIEVDLKMIKIVLKKGNNKILIPEINLIISDKGLFNKIIINVRPQNW